MEDPSLAWPYWKFGLKKDDLFSTLQDRYNTVPSSIQDPEAFHHDVYEIAHEASSAEEFHRLMADRKQYRLRELNDSLESAAVEIIANPSLVGTAQWQYALQLFRTKSLDSLVRYFASYLPSTHPWHTSGSFSSGSVSTDESLTRPFFDELHDDDKSLITHEPLCISTLPQPQLPPSPRSMTMQSDSSAASPMDISHHKYILDTLTPPRTLSFSECESDRFGLTGSHHDDDASHSDPETPTTSVSDLSETRSLSESDEKDAVLSSAVSETSIAFLSPHLPTDSNETPAMDSETPTPKPEVAASTAAGSGPASFFDAKPSPRSQRHRSCSPSRPRPLSDSLAMLPVHQHDHFHRKAARSSPRLRRRDPSLAQCGRRRSPADPVSRMLTPLSDAVRCRPKGRRRPMEC